jgi:hypothetical protein
MVALRVTTHFANHSNLQGSSSKLCSKLPFSAQSTNEYRMVDGNLGYYLTPYSNQTLWKITQE